MSWRLKTHTTCPPGEYRYEQTQGVIRKFKQHSDINTLSREVAAFRAANRLPRATFAEALEDVDFFNCQRLGFGEAWCYNTDKNFAATTPKLAKASGGCGACGAKV